MKQIYYGWIIVAIAGLGLFFSGPGQTYSVSVFIDYYIEDFGWSRSMVSGIYSLATLSAGLLLFVVGRFVDRFGPRKTMVAVGLMLGIAAFWNSVVVGPVMLFIGFFMLRLFGQGSLTLIPSTLVPQWFIQKRGRALSLMAIGGFISAALLPPLNAWLIAGWGWRAAWSVWGVLFLFFFVPLVYYFARNKPEDLGLLPDNASRGEAVDGGAAPRGAEVNVRQEIDWTLKEAMSTRAFWLILLCVVIPALVNTGLTFHLVSIMGEGGLTPATAAFVLSLMALVGFPVTLVAGFLVERVSVHYLLALMFIIHATAMLVLQKVETIPLAIVFGVIWGMALGFERISLSIVWPNYFGRAHLGSIKGVAMTLMVVGSAFGPLPFGVAYDLWGGYTEIIYLMLVFPILGILAALMSPAPRAKPELREQRSGLPTYPDNFSA